MTTKAELQKKVDELKAQIDAMEDDKPRTGRVMSVDELEEAQSVFYTNSDGNIFTGKFHLTSGVFYLKVADQGNLFHDRESAEREVKRRDIMQRMRVAAKESGEVDWGDVERPKYRIEINHNTVNQSLFITEDYAYRVIGAIYFATEESADAFIDSLTDEEIEILREVV